MTQQLKNTPAGRDLYTRLRFATLKPGEAAGGERKPYAPVNARGRR